MKRDMNQLDLRNAFSEMPVDCRQALLNAANSVEEDAQVKKVTFRAVLIAALIIVATTAVALAAGSLVSWSDFYKDYSTDVNIPQASLEEMKKAESFSCQVGPLTFETVDLITDGHIAMSNIHIRMTDGTPALLTSDPYDAVGAFGDTSKALAERLGISPEATWMEAAKQLNLPLYNVRAITDLDTAFLDGDEFEASMWNEDNSMVYFSRVVLNPDMINEVLETPFYLYAAEIDPETGDEKEAWRNRDQKIALNVCPVLETKEYVSAEPTAYNGFKLEAVTAQRYITGAYLTLRFVPANHDSALMQTIYGLHSLEVLDNEGTKLPEGMQMSASLDIYIELERMIGVNQLPDTLTLSDGTVLNAK